MIVRIGSTFLNLVNVVAVQVRNRERDGACIAVVETTADGERRGPRRPSQDAGPFVAAVELTSDSPKPEGDARP